MTARLTQRSQQLLKLIHHHSMRLTLGWLLAAIIAWQLGAIVWQFLGLFKPAPVPSYTLSTQNPSQNLNTVKRDQLLKYPLFKALAVEKTKETLINAPKTSLRLKLRGLLYAEDAAIASAIIENGNDGGENYKTGDKISGKASIHKIQSDRVILLRNGRHETLFLEQDSATSQVTKTKNRRSNSSTPSRKTEKTLRNSTKRYLKDASRNTSELMKNFSATPVKKNGKLQGFKINALKKKQLLKEIGLKDGDVLTSVNGIQLNDASQLMTLYQKLHGKDSFEATVINNDQSRTLSINLK